MTAEQTSELFT